MIFFLRLCLLCDGEKKDNDGKCIVQGCTQLTEHEKNDEPASQNKSKVCKICQEDTLTSEEFVKLKNCEHELCRTCFKRVDKMQPKCPFCQKWFDQPIGNQPENSTMSSKLISQPLPGFDKFKTIEITYSFPDGIQKANHPNPGLK